MELVNSLKERFRTEASAQFECPLCAMRFDQRPNNCPACGSLEIREIS